MPPFNLIFASSQFTGFWARLSPAESELLSALLNWCSSTEKHTQHPMWQPYNLEHK